MIISEGFAQATEVSHGIPEVPIPSARPVFAITPLISPKS
jgi:hypothetical protein